MEKSNGWKKEYHGQHKLLAQPTLKMAEKAKAHFAPKPMSEKETIGLLHNVYFILTNGLPVYKSTSLHSLVDYQLQFFGSDGEESDTSTHLSASHRSKHSTWEFVHALNRVVENSGLEKIRKAAFYSLLIDESNDISVTKNLMMYVQFIDGEEKRVRVMYLKTLPLKSCDADSILLAIVEFFQSIQVDLLKMVMFTSDGAAVMLGCNNGVFVKLRDTYVSHLIEHHCVAHKEALAAGSAYQSIPYFVELENVIKAIYSYFSQISQP